MSYLGRKGSPAPLISSDIPDDSITSAKIPDDALDSEHYTDGSIDSAHICDDQVTGAKIENNPTIAGNLTVSGDLVPATPLSHRNMIINGGMQVWQRATATTTTNYAGSGYATVDRWSFDPTADGVMTTEKHSMSLAEINTTGHHTALKAVCTTADASIAAGHYGRIKTHLEAQDLQQLQYGTANAKTMTLSFWIKSNKTGTYCFSIYKADATNYVYIKEFAISSADTWEKKTIVITPTAGSTSFITSAAGIINNDNALGLQLNIGLAWGSTFHGSDDAWTASNHYATSNQVNWFDSTSNNLYLTGVQLELGSSATPFEHRSFGDELQRCDRYYQKSFQYTTVPAHGVDGLYGSTTPYHTAICKLICHLSNPMRAVPDFTFYSSDSGASGSQVNSHDGSWGNHNANASGLSDRAFVLNFNHTGANTDETVLVNFNYEAVAEL